MAELKEGQQIIFKHPGTGALRQGVVKKHLIVFLYTDLGSQKFLTSKKNLLPNGATLPKHGTR